MDEAGPGCSFHPAVMLGCVLVLIVGAAAIVLLPWWLNVGLVLGVTLVGGLARGLRGAGGHPHCMVPSAADVTPVTPEPEPTTDNGH